MKKIGLLFMLAVLVVSWNVHSSTGGNASAASFFEPSESEHDESDLDGFPIENITLSGLRHTHPEVILNELLVHVGEPFSLLHLHQSLQRIRNTRIFRGVSGLATRSPEGKVDITITISEKWTLIPVVRGGVGGGTAFYVLGLYDLNSFGRYLDIGAQYENFAGASSGVAWFRDPQLFQTHTKGIFEAGYLNRQRSLYTPQGELRGAYLLTRRRGFVLFDHEFAPRIISGLGAELLRDTSSGRTLSTNQNRANSEFGFMRPDDTFATILRAHSQFGSLNYDEFLVDGTLLDFTVEGARKNAGSDVSFTRGIVLLNAFDRFAQIHNLGFRLSAGVSNAKQLQHQFYIGGLEHLRGFYDGQFSGNKFWFGNLEYRVPSLVLRQFVLHHVVFFDAGGASSRWKSLFPGSSNLGASAGTGLRFIVPFIARFNVRVDYAWAFSPHFQQGVVAGMQQFF